MPSQNDNNPRHQVVLMRESGLPASEVGNAVGLSTPTVLSLHEAYKAGSWAAVDRRTRGRPRVPQTQTAPTGLAAQFVADNTKLWTTDLLARWLSQAESKVINARAAQRRMSQWGWLPNVKPRKGALIAGTHITPNKGLYLLWACPPAWRAHVAQPSRTTHRPRLLRTRHAPLGQIRRRLFTQSFVRGHAIHSVVRTVAANTAAGQTTCSYAISHTSTKG